MGQLRASQRSKFAEVIRKHGHSPLDFDWESDPKPTFTRSGNAIKIFHKASGYYFKFEESRTSDNKKDVFYITYTPNEDSVKPKIAASFNWAGILQNLDDWMTLLSEELSAEDPWASPSGNQTFKDEDTKFTDPELVNVDKAIDAAFQTLINNAAKNGQERTLESIQADIKFLKDEARKQSRNKWLDLFKQVIAGIVLEWGLDAAINAEVLQSLYETAKPVLSLMA